MTKAIITGADGFVGACTTNYFLKQGIPVLAMDLPMRPNRLEMQEGLEYVSCDVFNSEALKEVEQLWNNSYDIMIHFAWRGSCGDERRDYHLQIDNAVKTAELMVFADSFGIKRFVCSGSIMEYELSKAIHGQGNRPDMSLMYSMGKALSHDLCKPIAANLKIDLVWGIITNAYGEGEYAPRFINNTLLKIIKEQPLVFTEATQIYDFVHVSDVAKAFYLMAKYGNSFKEYVIGSGNARPLKEFIHMLQETVAPHYPLSFGATPFKAISLPADVYNIDEIQRDCHYEAEVPFSKGIKRTYEWLRSHQNEYKLYN